MPQFIDDEAGLADDIAEDKSHRSDQRAKLALSLEEIAAEVGVALTSAGISIPVFFSIPSTGDALATFATPLDPTDDEWARVTQLICPIVGRRLGIENLCSQPLPCVAAGSPMGAADLLPARSGNPSAKP